MKKTLALGCGALVLLGLVLGGWFVSTNNTLVRLDEAVKAAWSQVENVYQRRADLIPNLVRTVQGAADFERETLEAVIQARAQATSIQVTPETLSDPQAFARFQQAQDGLGGALSRLLVAVERYPELKANANFRQLQDELAGTENRIAVERRRFNETAQTFNTERNQIPTVFVANLRGFREKAYFQATPGADRPPEVQFNNR
jgi:LemA protein